MSDLTPLSTSIDPRTRLSLQALGSIVLWVVTIIALAWAFAATGVFVVIADLLVRARFLDYLPIVHITFFMVVAWWLSMMFTSRYFR